MISQIIISNGILDMVTGILAKISLGTGIWAKFRLGKRKITRPVCFVKKSKLRFRDGQDNTKLKLSANSTGWNSLPIRIKI